MQHRFDVPYSWDPFDSIKVCYLIYNKIASFFQIYKLFFLSFRGFAVGGDVHAGTTATTTATTMVITTATTMVITTATTMVTTTATTMVITTATTMVITMVTTMVITTVTTMVTTTVTTTGDLARAGLFTIQFAAAMAALTQTDAGPLVQTPRCNATDHAHAESRDGALDEKKKWTLRQFYVHFLGIENLQKQGQKSNEGPFDDFRINSFKYYDSVEI